jgi:hypothetical protein
MKSSTRKLASRLAAGVGGLALIGIVKAGPYGWPFNNAEDTFLNTSLMAEFNCYGYGYLESACMEDEWRYITGATADAIRNLDRGYMRCPFDPGPELCDEMSALRELLNQFLEMAYGELGYWEGTNNC